MLRALHIGHICVEVQGWAPPPPPPLRVGSQISGVRWRLLLLFFCICLCFSMLFLAPGASSPTPSPPHTTPHHRGGAGHLHPTHQNLDPLAPAQADHTFQFSAPSSKRFHFDILSESAHRHRHPHPMNRGTTQPHPTPQGGGAGTPIHRGGGATLLGGGPPTPTHISEVEGQ